MKILFILSLLISLTPTLSGQSLEKNQPVVDQYGVIVRGDTLKKAIAIVFTGHEFADGGTMIRNALKEKKVPASFFFTGAFYNNPSFAELIRQLMRDGHYLGAHSNAHLLYTDWEKRDSTLVTEKQFKGDLAENYHVMKSFGIRKKDAKYFLPPYEWYNGDIARWTKEMGLTLINFSSGTRSNADYTTPDMGNRYIASEDIYQSILNYENGKGMNGFILLVHIGTDPRRTDKFYNHLEKLIDDLNNRGYTFLRIDKILH